MSTISASEAYRDFRTTVAKIEEEVDESTEETREKSEKQVAALEAAQKKSLKKIADSYERTIDRVKETGNEALSASEQLRKQDQIRAKTEVYDRFGRTRKAEMLEQQQALTKAHEDFEQLKSANAERNQKADANTSQRTEATILAEKQKSESAMRTQKADADQALQNIKNSQLEQDKSYKGELTRRYAGLEADTEERKRTQNSTTARQYEEMDKTSKRLEESVRQNDSQRRSDMARAYEDKADRIVKQSSKSAKLEVGSLNDQLGRIANEDRTYAREKAEGRAQGIREYERDYTLREKTNNELYKRQLDGFNEKTQAMDEHFARINDSNLRGKDAQYTDIIRRKEGEHAGQLSEALTVFEQNRAGLEERNKKDRELLGNALARSREDLIEQRKTDLQKQAKTYNEQMAREKESSDSQVASLKADLRNRATSNDLSLIPAAAEAELQKKLSGELDKRLNAETQRNSRQLDRILTNKQQEVIDVVADSQDTLSKYTRKNATERQMERSELLGHIADTEFMRDTKIRETERSANRSMELLERNYALAIERQRRDYEELLNTQKNDATLRLQTVQQQNEFERKMGQRAFSVSQNELIRNYEKRITDQKSEADAALYDLKVQADQKLREAEKRSKTLLEEQSRSYEQRLAQMEQTQSERERLLAANHREDLEKVQRAHALSQQRQKS